MLEFENFQLLPGDTKERGLLVYGHGNLSIFDTSTKKLFINELTFCCGYVITIENQVVHKEITMIYQGLGLGACIAAFGLIPALHAAGAEGAGVWWTAGVMLIAGVLIYNIPAILRFLRWRRCLRHAGGKRFGYRW